MSVKGSRTYNKIPHICSVYIVSQKVKNHRNLYKTFHNLSPFLYWGGLQVKWIMRVLWKFSEEGFVVSGKAHSLIHPYFPSCVKSVFSHSCIYHGMSVSFNMPIPLIFLSLSLTHTHTHTHIYICVCVCVCNFQDHYRSHMI